MYLYINGAAIARCGLVLTRAGSSHGMAGTMTIALTPAHNTHHCQYTCHRLIKATAHSCDYSSATSMLINNRLTLARHIPTHTPEPIPTTGTVTCRETIKLMLQKCGHEIIVDLSTRATAVRINERYKMHILI